MGSLDGKVALVTGGGSGIGRASAQAFAREGARVVVTDLDEPGGKETVSLVEEDGGEATFMACDVSDETRVKSVVAAAVDTYGGLHCAHNNAGIAGPFASLPDYPTEEWDRIIAINLSGVFYGLKYEIPAILESGGGAVVNTSSVAGLTANPYGSGYSAAKYGVIGLTRSASFEYASSGVRVNAICPGAIDTPMLDGFRERAPEFTDQVRSGHPIGRFGAPQEIAEAAVWLCSDAASFVTGVAFPVDGGASAI